MGWFGFGSKIPKGAVVFCDLAFIAEHSGICIGDDEIIHLNGDGDIEKVSFYEFIARLDGLNHTLFETNLSYFVDEDDNPIASKKFIKRAKNMLGSSRDYHPLLDNCHQFTSGCITGNFENSDNFFWMLKETIKNEFSISDLYYIEKSCSVDKNNKTLEFV